MVEHQEERPSPLQAMRKRFGYTLSQVEEVSNGRISTAYLSQLERGIKTAPTVKVCKVLADVYGLSVDEMRQIMEASGLSVEPSTYADAVSRLFGPDGRDTVKSEVSPNPVEELARALRGGVDRKRTPAI